MTGMGWKEYRRESGCMSLRESRAQLKDRAGRAVVRGYGALDGRPPVSELTRQLFAQSLSRPPLVRIRGYFGGPHVRYTLE